MTLETSPQAIFFIFCQKPRWPPAVKSPKLAKFDPANHISAWHLDPVYPIWTKCGIGILLELRNKPAEEFFIYPKIQDGRQQSKVPNRPNLTRKSHFGPPFRSRSSDLHKMWHRHTT